MGRWTRIFKTEGKYKKGRRDKIFFVSFLTTSRKLFTAYTFRRCLSLEEWHCYYPILTYLKKRLYCNLHCAPNLVPFNLVKGSHHFDFTINFLFLINGVSTLQNGRAEGWRDPRNWGGAGEKGGAAGVARGVSLYLRVM